jgi:hypothetical protein
MRTGLLLGISLTVVAQAAMAQAPNGDPSGALRRGFDEVAGYVTRAADMVPAEKYSYRPTASVRTFGQLIGHLADSHNYYCARAGGRNVEWADPVEKGSSDKATVVQKLKQSIAACTGVYGAGGQPQPLVNNVGHTNLHYGNIITYMRMMGMVPPSS